MSNTKLGEAAQRYAEEYGIPVFPLYGTHGSQCDCRDPACASPGKHPRTGKGFKDATLDVEQIRAWWEQWPNANIGMPTGPRSSYWVVDIDPPEGEQAFDLLCNGHPDLPEIPIQVTGRLGHQLFFAYDRLIRNSTGSLGPNIDVRGEGGYVVLPPSRHVTGRVYEWERSLDLGPIDAPDWLLQIATTPPVVAVTNGGPETGQGAVFGKDGHRNADLFRLARSLRYKGVGQAEALKVLRATNQHAVEQPAGREFTDSELQGVVANAYKQPDRPGFQEEREAAALSVEVENANQAQASNAEYLSRPAIIERLYYARHVSLIVGGKHAGKTTGVRTQALSIAMGLPVYGRETMQTPVLYAASPDEYPTTRMELLRMGWNEHVPLRLVRIKEAHAEPERVLADLARVAEKEGSRYIVLDMLFDFVQIVDELKYAHTRGATAPVQTLADETDGHVSSTHHSPKWMLEGTGAAQAALGSQGVSARFSPIVLYRRWADELYTVESSMTRDPRGLAIEQTCVSLDENGWAHASSPFQAWMKWRLFAPRIIALFQGAEPGTSFSVNQVKEALEVDRATAQNALYQMNREGLVQRRVPDRGRRILYRLPTTELFNDYGWS